MADTAGRAATGSRARRAISALPQTSFWGTPKSGTRHPLVAVAMVLPLAALLAVVFGGWDAVVTQASSVAGMLGR
ncbi:hypothetical protein AB0C51_08540 [Streptomyces pathocidini]|uniref:Uncharacterized protein n=1 Tax=Streptomyces pathocidini TaxID=1650571 RepID=A0ABW7UTX9_9ACTN